MPEADIARNAEATEIATLFAPPLDGDPLRSVALRYLERLVGPDPLGDARLVAVLKGPWDRTRKQIALNRRLRRLGLGVADRRIRTYVDATWRDVQRFVEVGTGTAPSEREIERAAEWLREVERAVDADHPLPRVGRRFPELRRLEAEWRQAVARADAGESRGLNLDRAHAALCEAQAAVTSFCAKLAGFDAGGSGMTAAELRTLAMRLKAPNMAVRYECPICGGPHPRADHP